MFAQFRNLKDLMTKFSDDGICRTYLEEVRWNSKPRCPHCHASKPYRLKGGKAFRCSSRTCRKDFSVTVGLVFENSKIPLTTWFAAIYLISAHKKGISSCQLAKDLGVTQKTAWFLNHRIRTAFGNEGQLEFTDVVEMDETYVGGKWENFHKSKRAAYSLKNVDTKIAVMGMVQRNGKASLKVMKDGVPFKDFVHKYVNPLAVVITDGHKGYRGIEETHGGHVIVNHSEGEYVNGPYHTNTVEGFFSLLKRGIIGIYHHVSPQHLHRYCEEFSFRYNLRRMPDNDRFVRTLEQTTGRLKYHYLIGRPKPNKKSVA